MYNNMRRGGQWLDVDEPPDHFPKPDLHPKKVMITVWWNATGIIHYSFLETVKQSHQRRTAKKLSNATKNLQ